MLTLEQCEDIERMADATLIFCTVREKTLEESSELLSAVITIALTAMGHTMNQDVLEEAQKIVSVIWDKCVEQSMAAAQMKSAGLQA